MKNKREKKNRTVNRKGLIKMIIAVILLVALLGYCIYVVYGLISSPTSTFLVENGKVDLEEEAIGYVIREEEKLQGENYKNGMVQIKAEGERAATEEQVFRYYSKGEDKLVKKIQELDEKIQEAIAKENNLLGADIKVLDEEIEIKLDEIAKNNNIQKITEYKKDISKAIDKKAQIAGDKSPAGSYLNGLIKERAGYEKELNSGSEYVKASKSGMVSYRVDGLEDVLTPEKFSSLTPEFLDGLNLKTGQIVATSNECGKIVNNFECYIASVMEKSKIHEIEVGNTKIKLRLSSSQEVPAEVVYKQEQEDEKVVVVFKITKGVEELLNYRKISFDIIFWDYEGLKVPNTALIEENGLYYVKRNRAGYIDKILVNITNQNDTYALIENYTTSEMKELGFSTEQIREMKSINLYDEILANPNE